jgi:membrane-bound lytic murein transglycosylase D
VSSDSDKLTQGLKKTEKSIPLPYHEGLEKAVLRYASKPLSNQFLAYSAIIDTALSQRNMPPELRYLPLALSEMRCNYSESDRYGVWQLPSLTAIHYGLTIDETYDERLDVEASTYAALDCLNELYQNYGDWWYSILAYTNSPVALQHVLIHHGETPELWDFKEQNLLPNTEVISNFIACVYLGDEGRLKFGKVADPVITKVPELVERPSKKTKDSATINKQANNKKTTSPSSNSRTQKHTVKKGDNLTKIATRYQVKVSDLMDWNNLKSDKILEGQTLIIKK